MREQVILFLVASAHVFLALHHVLIILIFLSDPRIQSLIDKDPHPSVYAAHQYH
jgi:hypothetical protein